MGNSDSRYYEFEIDSTGPLVLLNSSLNNSVIKGGVPLDFTVTEVNPFSFSYSYNSMKDQILDPPYYINTSNWSDMSYIVSVNVTDYAGNLHQSWYNITIDSSKPVITLITPSNNSIIQAGYEIHFEIFEPNLHFSHYSVNSGELQDLVFQWKINTTDWMDGTYHIDVFAGDSASNNISRPFIFHVDTTAPMVLDSNPRNHAKDVLATTAIRIQFNELMNKTSVKNAVLISPNINFTSNWSLDNHTLILKPKSDLINATTYTVIINTLAKDLAGNSLAEDFILSFSTHTAQKEDWTWLLYLSILAILLGSILMVWLIYTRKKRKQEEAEEAKEVGEAKEPVEAENVVGKDELDGKGTETRDEDYKVEGSEEDAAEKENEDAEEIKVKAEDSKKGRVIGEI
jgi:hypothetical protein